MAIIKHLLLPLLVICCVLEFEVARASSGSLSVQGQDLSCPALPIKAN